MLLSRHQQKDEKPSFRGDPVISGANGAPGCVESCSNAKVRKNLLQKTTGYTWYFCVKDARFNNGMRRRRLPVKAPNSWLLRA
ncbi:MAG: hypothetical protein JL56_03135 [Desulfotomaculum sp. BICA1-6]|nr:MAG: hypothetical protein JL56_03135 [Desulfotomaculum sp. BICA1-6]